MWWVLLVQAVVILVTVFFFLWIHDIPRNTLAKFRFYRNKSKYQAKRHFITGAQILSQARATNNLSLAAIAVSEADAAIRLDPSDAAAHILKSIALEFLGFKTSALEALDAGLSPLAVKSLSAEERADALVRRVELRRSGSDAVPAANMVLEAHWSKHNLKSSKDQAKLEYLRTMLRNPDHVWKKKGSIVS